MGARLTILLISIMMISCNKTDPNPEDFDKLADDYFAAKSRLNPMEATFYGQEQYNALLQLDMTDGFRAEQKRFFEDFKNRLSKIDTTALDHEQKLSYEIMQWEIDGGAKMLEFHRNLMPLHHFDGTHLQMAILASGTSAQPFKTAEDYEKFNTRMETYAVWLDSAIVYMRKGIDKQVVLPRVISERLVAQFEDMITEKPEDNVFYTAVKSFPDEITGDARKKIADKYSATISGKLIPRFRNMVKFLREEYIPASRSTSGIGAVPQGKEIYAALVKQWTTTDMTPEEIHELGLQEVARLRREMEGVKKQVGFTGDIKEFFDHVRNKKELKPFTKPEQVIENFEKIHARIKPNVDKLFSLQPKTPFQIKRTEEFREKTASAEYLQGSEDGTRPGTFYVPIPDVLNYNYYADEDLFLHEAIPGHHFQVSLQQENKKLPAFRKFNWFGAYGEGWALYTESLGGELGLYKDPYQYFGMLSSEMHRAIRLVVDTGIHSKGWTREQAIQYSLDNEAEGEASIIAEIERYMAMPGQALSYKIGQLKIIELRKRAETKLGAKFDVKKFHEVVLESGVLPLALLEKKVDRWIESVK